MTQAGRADGEIAAGRPPSVEADGFGWTYAGSSRPAVGSLSFRLESGRLLLVLGPSGSGKSTLARAIAGLVPHVLPGDWQGNLRIGPLEVAETPARFLGERVGLVFQDPDAQIVMSRVEDEVAFGLENRGRPRPSMVARVSETLARVGLAGLERRGTATLSGGEKQRLAVAGVLAAEPGLLVFDEPTANLDPPGMHAVFELLAGLAARGRHTIVLIEHRLEAALPLADDVLLLDDLGRQVAFGPAGSMKRTAIAKLDASGAWVPLAWQGADLRTPVGGGGTGPPSRATGPLLLEATSVAVRFPADETGQRLALDGVSLSLRRGERVALVGPNGAGKSSLLLTMAGLLRPSAGTVRLRALPGEGEPAEPMRDPARLGARPLSERIGLAFQDPELGFVGRTARDEVEAATVAAGRGARTSGGRQGDADTVLDQFGLGDHAADDPFRLSQGEQRRLSLAALALRPPGVLLLDEPTFGLDRRGTEAVLELLDRMRSAGQAQVLATHDPRLLPVCERVVALDGGRIVFDGSPDAFLAAPPFRPPGPWRDGVRA